MKNTLVQYPVVSTAGCFWEYNYFFLDKDGQFHNIFSSGRNGIESADLAQELLASSDIHYTYDMTDDKAIEEFSLECNVVNITVVLQWFNDNSQDGIDFFVLCSECGEWQTDRSEVFLEDWHGCGGIQSTADKLICSECYSYGTCDCCNKYVGKDGFEYLQDTDDCSDDIKQLLVKWDQDIGPACQYCWETKHDNLIRDEQKDMLSMSLLTGKPDLFSDDMRWYWGNI